MRYLFYSRGLLFLWAMITGATILSDYLKQYADDLSHFNPETIQTTHEAVLRWVLAFAQSFLTSVAPRINDKAFEFTLPVLNFKLAPPLHDVILVIDVVILIAAILRYRKAIKSDSFFDDFLALLILYVVFIFVTAVAINLHVVPWLDSIQRPFVASAMIILLFWAMGKKALNDTKIFFRGLLQAVLIGLVMLPDYTLRILAEGLRNLYVFGGFLKANPIIFTIWASLGVAGAMVEVYNLAVTPKKEPAKQDPLEEFAEELEAFKAMIEAKRKVKEKKKSRGGLGGLFQKLLGGGE